MEFQTEWWSKLMVLTMIIIAIIISPELKPEVWGLGSALIYLLQIVAYPLIAIAIATIPVVIICWISKILPDLDYSIWLAFGYMLFLLINHFV